jgi:RHS repeat-associated protein
METVLMQHDNPLPYKFMLWKIVAGILIIATFTWILPVNTWALSSWVISPENYPGKMEVKNVNGLGKNISTDFFGGAMTFAYPFSFPSGSRGMTPSLALSYASNNTDAFSPYGYGFSLSIPRIQRSAKKWVSELYIGDEYAAFWNDLIKEAWSQNRYRSKDGNDLNLYVQSGSSWIVQTPDGRSLTFGSTPLSRIADSTTPSKIYAWLIDEERDDFGHMIRYTYLQDGGQSYISDIFYGFETTGWNPIYQVHFDYIDKWTSLTSYRTQFEIRTRKLLSQVSLKVSSVTKHTYSLAYDNPDTPISHLMSISEDALGVILPKVQFVYGAGQFQHMIVGIDNNRWGKANFEYTPSTGYRDGSGTLLNSKLPFMVMTLSRQVLEDTVTGIKSEESYSYSGGHYYYDPTDFWGREYVGFGQVSITDEKVKKVLYFHQSQTAWDNPLKYQDHISKKGRVYRTDILDKASGKLLQQEIVRYNSRVLFGDRRLVYPMQKIGAEFAPDGAHRDTATTYEYDDDGNLTSEIRLGLVSANLSGGTYIDIPWDTTTINRTYTANISKNLHNFQTGEKFYGFSGELLSESSNEYDNTASWITLGLLTAKKRQNVQNGDTVTTDRIVYSPTGMPIERYDAMNNRTSSTYDTRDIALISSQNPLGWTTQYVYDYAIGKPTQVTNQNNVVSTTHYDGFGRITELLQNSGSGDILLTRNSYDDINIPNSTTSTQYFDATASDSKTTKSYMDGWGRTIATVSTTEKSGQYSATQIRYDDDGNPIYAGYPVFVSSNSFDTSLVLKWVTDGERYRAIAPGVSYQYDTLDRIISQRDARWVTTKSYIPWRETITNALGYTTEARYDEYGNLSSFIEKMNGRDIATIYNYDGLGRPIGLTDAYSNIRTWSYDGLGRLASATDLHALADTTYGIRQYEYDVLGRVKKYINANNEEVSYSYDSLSRITHESSTASGSALDRTYSYDADSQSLGTLSSVSDAGSIVNFIYDSLGRKTGETRIIGDKSYTLGYGYNPASIITNISYPDGGHTEYTYRNGFIEWVGYTDPSGNSTQIISDIAYSPNSTMRSIRYGNGVVKNTERDVNNNYRLTRATATTTDGTKLLDTSYGYDEVSNITNITEGGIEPLRKSLSYTYDPLARLTSANYSYSIAGYGRDQVKHLAYTYDDIGNIMSATDVWSYAYAGTNFANPHAVTGAGDTNYSYDPAGNTVSRGNTTDTLSFTYSPYGEMLSSVKNGDITNYLYDHTRRRIVKSTLGLTEHHVIDGYEVEYESGALVPVNPPSEGGSWSGAKEGGSLSGATDSGSPLADSGITESWGILVDSWVTNTGSTESGTILMDSGVLNPPSEGGIQGGSVSESGSINTGTTDSGSTSGSGEILTDTWTTESGATIADSGGVTQSSSTETESGETISFSWETSSGSYIVVAGYVASSLSWATPITLTTTLTHIYFWDEKIATFQSQTDDSGLVPPWEGGLGGLVSDDQCIFHISDHLNSSSLDISSTGVILQATDYQPFWKTITYQVTNQRVKWKKWGYKNKYLFANKQQDDETDLQYFEKRYYDNRIGRFTTEDPVFWEVGSTLRPAVYFGDPQQWNSYSYTRNNPINLVDPTGEFVVALVVNPYTVAAAIAVSAAVAYEWWKVITAVAQSLSNISSTSTTPDKTVPNNNKNAQSQAWQETTGQWQTVPNSEAQVWTASPPPSGGGNNGNKGGKDSKWQGSQGGSIKSVEDLYNNSTKMNNVKAWWQRSVTWDTNNIFNDLAKNYNATIKTAPNGTKYFETPTIRVNMRNNSTSWPTLDVVNRSTWTATKYRISSTTK